MEDILWIKLSLNIVKDEKMQLIDSMPERDALFRFWIILLLLAAKCGGTGVIYLTPDIPYTDEMLATVANRPLNIIRLALDVFQRFGMIDVREDRKIELLNWGKYQNADALVKIREQTRLRVQRFRDRHKQIEAPKRDIEEEGEGKRNSNVTLPRSPKRPGTEEVKDCPGVYLTPVEYRKLCLVWEQDSVDSVLADLSNKLGNTLKANHYKDHYKTAQNWLKRAESWGGARRRPEMKYCANPECGKPYEGTVCTACGVEE